MTDHPVQARTTGGDLMTWLSDCYKKPPPTSLQVGDTEVGIAGLEEIMEAALQKMDSPDEDVKEVLMNELGARNYVPSSVRDDYLMALWAEYKKLRTRRKDEVEESYRGIPREDVPWYPRVDKSRCEGCSSCVEFCSQKVFEFFDGKSQVVRPYSCLVGKSSCRAFCPDSAISFPTKAEFKENLRQLRASRGLD
jgi:NAD-dependent dihydropyrimidine dehydrogenase PreA subunit